jgi:predicted transcriptional regulator
MPDEPPSPTLDTELTTNIVAAYVRRNQIGADQLPVLISTVYRALVSLGKPAAETEVERTPAVTIRQSVHRDYVVCLDFGWRGQMRSSQGRGRSDLDATSALRRPQGPGSARLV